MIFTVALSMIVILPVFVMTALFAYKYREGNTKAKYTPEVEGNNVIEAVWWGIPILIISVLSVVTWFSSHDLDPYKSLDSNKQPLRVQVVALQWKWLFIYPEQGIASVNEVRFPAGRPVNFELTADAPMSAFWIPNLGSQTYAMNGMTSKLHLEADAPGEFNGSNTNISGEGYAGMNFKAIATTEKDFTLWAKNLSQSDRHLDWAEYEKLAKPSKKNPVTYYMLHDSELVKKIVTQYEHGGHGTMESNDNEQPTSGHDAHMKMEGSH